jgi:hypothetical protein
MAHVRLAVLAVGAVLAATAPGRADDAAARAVIDKAIMAHGGEEALAKYPAASASMSGKIHAMGMEIPFSGDVLTSGNDKVKIDLQIEVGAQKIRVTNVITGEKGWSKIADNTMELDKDQVAEAREQAHGGWVITLVPLKDKKFTLSSLGESEIDKKTVVGVKVACPGRRDIDLYFDKETGLLVKRESRAKDDNGQEVNEESFFSAYKDVQGTKQPMKIVVKRDGKVFVEAEVTNMTLVEKFDATTFTKP